MTIFGWRLQRPEIIRITLRSGYRWTIKVWNYDIKYGAGDTVTATSWKQVERPFIRLMRADQIDVVEHMGFGLPRLRRVK